MEALQKGYPPPYSCTAYFIAAFAASLAAFCLSAAFL
jgi:hypothetical protein